MKKILLCVWWCICAVSLYGQPGAGFSAIDSLIARLLPAGSEVGIAVYDLTARQSLYAYRDAKLSRPASTMKLLTAITALSRADGADPFATEVWHDGLVAGDTLHGNLYVVGGFDPEFGDEALDSLVARVAALPFSVIRGQVLGDVSMKDSLYWGNGWAWDDNPEAYQPYLSPLMLCKGVVEVRATPGATTGGAATVTASPVSSYYTLTNATVTRGGAAAGKFSVSRNWLSNGNHLVAGGNVSSFAKGWVNVYDSKSFFMHTFVERLRAKGVAVEGSYGFADLPAGGVQRMARWETPVQQVLDQLMKESDNLNAEALLCRLGAQATGSKRVSAREGLAQVTRLIGELGHDASAFKLADGSGLSNYNYVSPALLVDFLRYAYSRSEVFARLYKSLPVAGVDGTLKNRMKAGAAYRNVHAKTGSFTAINALAGYLKMKNGHDVAFAIINQNVLSAATARAFQDRVCEVIAAAGGH